MPAFFTCAADIKAHYEWIYNPPVSAQTGKTTEGSIAREEFANHYGGYLEMVYLMAKGDPLKFDEITSMPLNEFLFLAEYLLRKRIVENIK